eukprot:4505503-Prymnesium_polylepis.1
MRGPFHGLTLCSATRDRPAAAARAWRVEASCASNACTQSGSARTPCGELRERCAARSRR